MPGIVRVSHRRTRVSESRARTIFASTQDDSSSRERYRDISLRRYESRLQTAFLVSVADALIPPVERSPVYA